MSDNQASPANDAVLTRLLNSLQKQAALLGYENWAQTQLEGSMVKGTKAVSYFLDDMHQVVKPSAKKEIPAISTLLKEQDDIDAQVWDVQYGINRLKSHLFPGFDSKEVRQYFLVEKVLPALRTIVQDMFCLRFEETDIRAWHPSATSYLVYDKSRNEEVLIGRLFFDVSSREGNRWSICTYCPQRCLR
jgi:Zn-dependent oligopeptidase